MGTIKVLPSLRNYARFRFVNDKNTKTTEQLRTLDKRHVWHPFTQMQDWERDDQIVIEKGEGCWLIDTDGNRYLDGVASMWTNVHGHCCRELNEALKIQVDRLEHSTCLLYTSPSPRD